MAKTVAIVQARMSSSRMPGKSLMDLAGKPLLQHVIERLGRSRLLDGIVIATTDDAADAPILEFAAKHGISAYAGDRDDVLARYLAAATQYEADIIVRVTGDCPLIDPRLSDDVIAARAEADAEYAGNFVVRSFPRGADTEAFTIDSFGRVAAKASRPYEREHVTPYYYLHREEFRLISVEAKGNLRRPELRLCVDTDDDLQLVRTIFERLGPGNSFSIPDIVALVEKEPRLADINGRVRQKPLF